MTKVRSREECLNAIQADSAWRKKEIAILKGRITDERITENDPLLRSGVVMVYAHWEGFVKNACELYLAYINELIKRRSIELSHHFSDLLMWKMYRQKGEHLWDKNPVPFLEMRKEWPASQGELLPTDVIDPEANLSSRVLKRITATIDIDYSHFETKEKLIDESLLKMRNLIAHGERISVALENYETIEKEIRELIDCFQQLVEQCVQQERYRAIDSPATPTTPADSALQ